jgi:hypothetical protein
MVLMEVAFLVGALPRVGRCPGKSSRPLLSVGVKDAESGGKERQIRHPFHLHVQFPRKNFFQQSLEDKWTAFVGCDE